LNFDKYFTQMKKVVDEGIIQRTECSKGFCCLNNEKHSCLNVKIDRFVSGETLFIDCKDESCDYRMTFGKSVICKCPTRMALFKKYNI